MQQTMQPLQCAECGVRVLVQKNSWEHTSIQWNEPARAGCPEMSVPDAGREGRPGAPRTGCAALAASITHAVESGLVAVRDPDPIPTPIVVD